MQANAEAKDIHIYIRRPGTGMEETTDSCIEGKKGGHKFP